MACREAYQAVGTLSRNAPHKKQCRNYQRYDVPIETANPGFGSESDTR